MKKFILSICAAVLMTLSSCSEKDEGPLDNVEDKKDEHIPSDMKIAFPDKYFRSYVLANFDIDKNGIISKDETLKITEIDVTDQDEIKSLEGIQYFKNLEYLDCSYNQLTSLDVSKNTKLTELGCQWNQLTSLNVFGCTSLTELWCRDNQLTSLDVSGCPALTRLDCDNNQLTSLDVSKNTKLTELGCSDNKLTTLNVSNNKFLDVLGCNMPSLERLFVKKNQSIYGITDYRYFNNFINPKTTIEYIN